MNARRGWCPDIHAPMRSGDGFLVRVKPRAARLAPETVHAIADAAARWGSGIIELTSRANLQIRGLSEAALPDVAAAMIACGAAEADAQLERQRNIIVSPLLGSDPGVHPATATVAAAILAWLRADPARELPPKYGFVVDGGGTRPLRDARGDVVLRLGGPAPAAPSVGYIGYLASDHGSVGLAPAFGQTSAVALRALADLAVRDGDGLLRIGPWRGFLIGGVASTSAERLMRAAAGIGFIGDPADARLRIAACPGRPACAGGLMPARADAAALAAVPAGARVHVSGCAKGCAHPGAADYTFVGTSNGYSLVRNGRASDARAADGLGLADLQRLLAA